MRDTTGCEFPPDKVPALRRALRLEWLSIFYFLSAVVVTALVMGQSQVMKTTLVDDMLGVVPPISVLIAARVRRRDASTAYPYGYHRCVTIAFLVAAVSLLALGLLLIVDGGRTLVLAEHPTLGTIDLFGRSIWLGWPMLAALLWSSIPTIFLGRAKVRLARQLHDKALHSDAMMNRADWMAGLAAVLGILGVGFGYWWTDAVAAILIALDITHDGWKNLRAVIADLLDRKPRLVDDRGWDPLPEALERAFEQLPWVRHAAVRLRENGHVFFGEADLVPTDEAEPLRRIREARALAHKLDWRLKDLCVQLLAQPDEPPRDEPGPRPRAPS